MMTLDNTIGYTQTELDALNEEFEARWDAHRETGEFAGLDRDQAEKQFADEISRR